MNIKASDYFLARRPDTTSERPMYNRIINALLRCGDISMIELCKIPEKELKKVRNLGKKARSIVMEECRNFCNEGSDTYEDNS